MLRSCTLIFIAIFIIPNPNQDERSYLLKDPQLVLGDHNKGSNLSQVFDFTFLNGDTIYVLDRRDKKLIAFDMQGEELFRFGREGMGPGEFINPITMCAGGGLIYVGDSRQSRVTEFTSTGEFVRTIPVQTALTDILVVEGYLYIASPAFTALIWRVSLSEPQARTEVLTWDHPGLADVPQNRRLGGKYLCLAGDEIIVGLPGCGLLASISVSNEEVRVISPDNKYISEYWDRYNASLRQSRTSELETTPQSFGPISEWTDGNILLEVHPHDESEFISVGIVIDKMTGLETGVRVGSTETRFTHLQLLDNGHIAGIDQYASVAVFEIDMSSGIETISGLLH